MSSLLRNEEPIGGISVPSASASESEKSAIDALQKFYSVIVAAAFSGAVLKSLELFSEGAWTIEKTSQTVLFMSFLVTIVPFYHGMERHLFESHINKQHPEWGDGGKASPLLGDVFIFMILGAILFAMGRFTDRPDTFYGLWVALLVIDILWSLWVWRFNRSPFPRWVIVNSIAVAGSGIVWLLISLFAGSPCIVGWPIMCSLIVAQMALIFISEATRSFFDYKLNWNFYFPKAQQAHNGGEVDPPRVTYLACPYTKVGGRNADQLASPAIRAARYNAVTAAAARLIEEGHRVYSPITMTHPIDLALVEQQTSDFWVELDRPHMELCSRIIVLTLDGWEESSGVQKEIQHFERMGIEFEQRAPADFGIAADNADYQEAFIF
ncbi:MAG: DUF1937 family protein [Erythrobacter sp.]